jgi:hypothetical protein
MVHSSSGTRILMYPSKKKTQVKGERTAEKKKEKEIK